MTLMMLGEKNLRSGNAEMARDDPFDPKFFAERIFHRLRKALPAGGECTQSARQNALELEHRFFVEDDRVEIFGLQFRSVETPLDGCERKRRVVFLARQTLFLNDRYGHAVDDESRGRVVIVR